MEPDKPEFDISTMIVIFVAVVVAYILLTCIVYRQAIASGIRVMS